jgi:hypothetical protein
MLGPDLRLNHHLHRRGRLWWVALTVYRKQFRVRLRRSLGTADITDARQRRDELIESISSEVDGVVVLRRPSSMRF